MQIILLLGCLSTMGLAQELPGFSCADESFPSCECLNPPCVPGGNSPVCMCEDGSDPVLDGPCPDGSFPPPCPGACLDGSDAVLNPTPLTVAVCQDGSFADTSLCVCEDGSTLLPIEEQFTTQQQLSSEDNTTEQVLLREDDTTEQQLSREEFTTEQQLFREDDTTEQVLFREGDTTEQQLSLEDDTTEPQLSREEFTTERSNIMM